MIQPLGVRGRARGFLAVGAREPLRANDQAVVNLAVSLLSLALLAIRGAQRGRARGACGSGAPAARRLGRRAPARGCSAGSAFADRPFGWSPPGPPRSTPSGVAAAEDRLAEALPGSAVASGVLPEDASLVVAITTADADLGAVRGAVGDAEPLRAAGVGDGADLDDAASLRRSLARARRALAAGDGGVRRYDDLGGGLEALLDPAAADAWAAALVSPLDEPAERADLAATLLAWLRRHGQVDAAAADLGVHRHTVRHRLRRAESLLGRSLDDAGVRAELYLALTRLPGASTGSAPPGPRRDCPGSDVARAARWVAAQNVGSRIGPERGPRGRRMCRCPARCIGAGPEAGSARRCPCRGRTVVRMTDVRPAWIAGRPVTSDTSAEVTNPYDGSVVGAHAVPDADQVEEAVAAAWAVRHAVRGHAGLGARRGPHARVAAYHRAPRRDRRAHHRRERQAVAVGTRRGESRGERVPLRRRGGPPVGGRHARLDTDAASAGRAAIVRRFPYGPVLGIAPFNFPLNLVAHKVAPAIAVGAPIIVKPAPATPLSALLLGELLAETDLPAGSWSVLPVGNDVAPALVADARLPIVSFTGSEAVGFAIQKAVPHKHVTLELGGNAAAVVLPGLVLRRRPRLGRDAHRDLRELPGRPVVRLRAAGARRPRRSGTPLVPQIVAKVEALPTGSPWDEATVVGPLVDEKAAIRVEAWVDEAVDAGATLLTGGRSRRGVVRADRADRRARRREGVVRGGLRAGAGARAGRRRRRGVRDGQRQPLRAADRRVHPRPAGGVPGARRARGGRRRRRRRAVATAPTRCPTAG